MSEGTLTIPVLFQRRQKLSSEASLSVGGRERPAVSDSEARE
jgi:hypothetical protein